MEEKVIYKDMSRCQSDMNLEIPLGRNLIGLWIPTTLKNFNNLKK